MEAGDGGMGPDGGPAILGDRPQSDIVTDRRADFCIWSGLPQGGQKEIPGLGGRIEVGSVPFIAGSEAPGAGLRRQGPFPKVQDVRVRQASASTPVGFHRQDFATVGPNVQWGCGGVQCSSIPSAVDDGIPAFPVFLLSLRSGP